MVFFQGSCSRIFCSGLLVYILMTLFFVCLFIKSCLTLYYPMNCSFPGCSIHGLSQARILEWVAISFSRDLPDPGIKHTSPVFGGGFFTMEPPEEPILMTGLLYLWDFVTSCSVAGSVGIRFPFCYSPCYHPAPALAHFSKLLLTLVGESETCCWLPPTSLGMTNCLTIIHNTAM